MLLDPYARRCYSQEGEDILLDRLLDGQRSGFYVDVGAHHPSRFSNTFLFYLRGWRGVNIDADPEAIELFRRHRRRDINVAAGVSDAPGRLLYHRFDDAALNTFDAGLAAARVETGRYRELASEPVDVMRLDAILEHHLPSGTPIDFLSVDVEGLDLNVLRSNDWQKFRPRFVLAESLGLALASLASDATQRFLADAGYEWISKTLNTLIWVDRRRA